MIIGKSVSPVGIDMGIQQLLLDVRSKTNNFQNASYIFRPKLAAHQGSSAGTVLDPLLDHIGNVQNLTAESVQFLIQL